MEEQIEKNDIPEDDFLFEVEVPQKDKKSLMERLKIIFKKFVLLPYPEKIFVLFHPFKAEKIWDITCEVLKKVDEMKEDPSLDGDANGGQVDAFRHAFWMARISMEISPKIALKFGKIHEKSNRIAFKKKKKEDGALADRVSCEMDLKNNEVGVRIAEKNPNINEMDLISLLKDAIITGQLWIIKKNKKKEYLDWQGNVLKPKDYQGKWNNRRCLVPSDYVHEN